MNYKEFSDTVNDLKVEDYSTLLTIVNQYRMTQNSLGFLCPVCDNAHFEFLNAIKYTHEHWVMRIESDSLPLSKNYSEFNVTCVACDHSLHKGHETDYYDCFECHPDKAKVFKELWSFKELPHSWDFGDGDAINTNLIVKAIRVAVVAFDEGFWVEATPISNGNIDLTIGFGGVDKDESLTVLLLSDGTYCIDKEKGVDSDSIPLEEVNYVDFDTVKHYIEEL